MNYKLLILLTLFLHLNILYNKGKDNAQLLSRTFELRYFTSDSAANGEADFKGETQWFDTESRISFLSEYASFASLYFENPGLDKEIVTDNEIDTKA